MISPVLLATSQRVVGRKEDASRIQAYAQVCIGLMSRAITYLLTSNTKPAFVSTLHELPFVDRPNAAWAIWPKQAREAAVTASRPILAESYSSFLFGFHSLARKRLGNSTYNDVRATSSTRRGSTGLVRMRGSDPAKPPHFLNCHISGETSPGPRVLGNVSR